MTTIHERLTALRRLLDATENALNLPEPGENDASRKFRHSIAHINIMRVSNEAQAIGNDLSFSLINDPFKDTHSLVYLEPASEV